MNKTRLEAFSDGMIAIFITIMVLEFTVPHEATLEALRPLLPVFLAYVLSFLYLGIYWNNHHHMLQTADHVDGWVLWTNLHLLFWLSLVPFATAWMSENHFEPLTVAVYGFVLLMAGAAYSLLQKSIISHHGQNGLLRTAIGRNLKGKASLVAYALAIPLAFVHEGIALGIFATVALLWFIPDRRISRKLEHGSH